MGPEHNHGSITAGIYPQIESRNSPGTQLPYLFIQPVVSIRPSLSLLTHDTGQTWLLHLNMAEMALVGRGSSDLHYQPKSDLLGPHGSGRHQDISSAEDVSLGLLQGMRESFESDISTSDHSFLENDPQTPLRGQQTSFIHSSSCVNSKHIIVSNFFHVVNNFYVDALLQLLLRRASNSHEVQYQPKSQYQVTIVTSGEPHTIVVSRE